MGWVRVRVMVMVRVRVNWTLTMGLEEQLGAGESLHEGKQWTVNVGITGS